MWRIGNYVSGGKKRREMLMITLKISQVCAIGSVSTNIIILEKLGGGAALRAAHFLFLFFFNFPPLRELNRLYGKIAGYRNVAVQPA